MSRKTTILALIVLVGLAGACAKQEQASPAEEAWSGLVEAWNGLETAEDKTALAKTRRAHTMRSRQFSSGSKIPSNDSRSAWRCSAWPTRWRFLSSWRRSPTVSAHIGRSPTPSTSRCLKRPSISKSGWWLTNIPWRRWKLPPPRPIEPTTPTGSSPTRTSPNGCNADKRRLLPMMGGRPTTW